MTPIEFTDEELNAFREELCKGATEGQFQLFIAEAKARNLRPGAHLFFQLRNVNEWDPEVGAKVRKQRATWITKIDAFRLISQRTGKDAGRGKTRWIYLDDKFSPTIESTIPLPDPKHPHNPREPYACVVPIYRSDYKEPVEVVCRFDAFAVTTKSGNELVLTDMWQRRGPEQLEKCSEVASRRAAYPEELGSLYLDLEFKNEDDAPHTTAVTPASVVPLPPPVPAVNQIPAQGTEAPRPGEAIAEFHVTSIPATLPKHSGSVLRVVEPSPKEEDTKTQTAETTTGSTAGGNSAETEPKKRTRKPKEEPRPENGQNQGGITDEDLKNIGTPAPVVDEEAAKRETEEFIAGIDPTPTKEEQHGFTARVRALSAAGAKSEDLKNYILNVGKKSDTKQLTIRDWKQALDQLEAAQAEGKLVEVSKAAPLPAF